MVQWGQYTKYTKMGGPRIAPPASAGPWASRGLGYTNDMRRRGRSEKRHGHFTAEFAEKLERAAEDIFWNHEIRGAASPQPEGMSTKHTKNTKKGEARE